MTEPGHGSGSVTLTESFGAHLIRQAESYLRPENDDPLPGARELTDAGVSVVSVPDCGHNIMLDNPEAFAAGTARALNDPDPSQRLARPAGPPPARHGGTGAGHTLA